MINRAFRSIIKVTWYFIGVYIINRTFHGRLEIRNFSSRVEETFRISARPCIYPLYILISRCDYFGFLYDTQLKSALDTQEIGCVKIRRNWTAHEHEKLVDSRQIDPNPRIESSFVLCPDFSHQSCGPAIECDGLTIFKTEEHNNNYFVFRGHGNESCILIGC